MSLPRPQGREYDPSQPVLHCEGWQPSPEIIAKAAALLHEAQSMRGRWMDMGERADYLLAHMPEISVGWEARLIALRVDTVAVEPSEAA
jgi:hypothetical protein